MYHFRTLIVTACLASLGSANAQSVPCPGESLTFQLEGEYYGTKTWEYSNDGVTWTAVDVIENEPFVLQPEQSGWYRVRFFDETCGISYVSEAQRFAAHSIDLGEVITLSIGGVVRNELGGAVSGATVRAGCGTGVSTTTDHFGVYLLEGVTANEELAAVTVEKEGYFTGTRSFIPGESAMDAISHAYITLLQKNVAGTVSATTGGTLNLEGMNITFPANAFTQNGAPYTGPVSVYLNHIDPTSVDLHDQMPGMLMGVQDDQPQLLYSYGMAGVELTDAAGNGVQLAPGSSATVRFPVMAAQQGDAPATIPLWWFDEDLGYWVEEGEAQRVGDQYVAPVSHFSWWNCDVPANFVLLKGNVIDQASGAILSNAQVRLISATMGTGTTYTNAAGEFTGLVPVNQVLTLQVWLPCGPLGAYVMVHEETVGPFSAVSAIVVQVDSPDLDQVVGQVLDCAGVPVEDGYVWANGQVVFCSEGFFVFATCSDSVALRAVDLATDSVSDFVTIALNGDTTDLGELLTCTPLFGSVSDIDGNTYPTIIIGAQEWMAANLKTTRYRDGSIIPNAISNATWANLDSGAWCNFTHLPVNDSIYGKLYNWYAAADPNICPQGWHVPTDAEWTILTDHLGGTNVAASKMKAVSPLWSTESSEPIADATNESGFSGLPGGLRSAPEGWFLLLGERGGWWSASPSSAQYAWTRSLYHDYENVLVGHADRRTGYCLRCVRD